MKMRKKIAALLAAAMVATMMPMTAFAASTTRVTHVARVADGGSTNAPKLEIELKDDLDAGDTFYLNLENAEWQDLANITTAASANLSYTIEDLSATELAIEVSGGAVKGEIFTITMATKEIKGEAVVKVTPWDIPVTASETVFAIASTGKAIVTVEDPTSFYAEKAKLAKVTIEEAAAGALIDNPELSFILDNDEFEFKNVTAKFTKGLSNANGGADATETTTGFVKQNDGDIIDLDFSKVSLPASGVRGVVEITFEVKSTERRPSEGKLNMEITGDLVEDKSYHVADIAAYGVELVAEKEYEFFAGNTEEVVFHINEIVQDSMVSGRTTEVSLPEGVYFNRAAGIKLAGNKLTSSNFGFEIVEDDDKRITGFMVDLVALSNEISEFEFEAKLDISSDFEGDVVMTTEGRAFEDLEAVIATVKPSIKVTIEPMTVKVGLKEQIGGKVIIEELEKGALNRGKDIFVQLETENGIYVTGADIEVTAGDLRKGDIDIADTTAGAITIGVKRSSREASTIELTNIKVKLDRTVPEGAYDIKVGGPAISALADLANYGNDNIVAKDFLFVGERYTRPVAVFTIGSNVFTVNGEPMTMDAEAFIKDGRTMVPLRYLSYALGIDKESIKFNSGIVTIFTDDGKVIQVKNGDRNLVINGMSIPMVTSAEIIEGRTYVPITEIGGVFGVTGTWDAATQTATFQ